ncbi:3'-5' exonuclease [Micromonospora sp. LOL_027]|uniref:3'-5' exonuclease n=1 Tax=Micromonospora sp. LOL_027 TaxID=3345419 RepID=UPI003A83F006
MFTRGELTRRSGADPRALTYAVIDLETTGLNPNRGSRVCELAIVRMRGDGVGLDEYSTLINPGMRINSDEYYVSHNLDHEEKFLVAEFGRLGVNLSDVPGLCSLVTARTQIDSWGYKLEYVHHLVTGEWLDAVHSALGDARALAVTLTKFVNEAPQRLFPGSGRNRHRFRCYPAPASSRPELPGCAKAPKDGWRLMKRRPPRGTGNLGRC